MSIAKVPKHVEKELHQNKVVIRRLPPDFTEENFLHAVNPLPSNSYYYFSPGDTTLGSHGCSRAYVVFNDQGDILPFRDHFDGHILESENGLKYRMTVEYAPFQGVPKKGKKKADSRIGTIEQDSDYKAFLEAYESTEEQASSLDLVSYILNLDANKTKDVQPTPLTEYLDKRGARRRGKASEAKKKQKKESSSKGKGRESKEEKKSTRFTEEPLHNGKKDKPTTLPTNVVTKDRKDTCRKGKDPLPEWSVMEPSPAGASKVAAAQGASKQLEDTGERRSRNDSLTKNRDRPDKAIYTPRSREDSKRGKSERKEGEYHGKSQRYRGKNDAEYKHRDDHSSGRPRGRGRGFRDRGKERSDLQ